MLDMVAQKNCSSCGYLKPLTGFYKNKKSKDGTQGYCKICSIELSQKYYHENGDRLRDAARIRGKGYFSKTYVLGGGAWIAKRVCEARARAIKKNVAFDEFALRAVLKKCSPGDLCPCLGIELVIGNGHPAEGSASVDRIKPELGYVAGNIAVISQRANMIKSSATAQEVRAVSEWMEELGL